MQISHIWTDQETKSKMAWATPSRREYAKCKKAGGENVLGYCTLPRGWDCAESDDTSDDGGSPGLYLVRK